MKKLMRLTLLAWLLPVAVYAQEFKTKFTSTQGRKVVLDVRGARVTVEGYDGDELAITGVGYREAPTPALASGLRPIYAGGADNTHLGLSVTPSGDNTLRVSTARGADGHYTVRVPRRADVAFAQSGWGGSDDLTLRNLDGRIEVSLKSGNLRLLNVSGPVVANSISGDIRVQFSGVPEQPCALSTVSGNVDVTLPAPAKVSLSMRSISGEIYTDFDLNLGDGGMQHIGGQTVEGRANGGGTRLLLKTVSGNVFVRKAK